MYWNCKQDTSMISLLIIIYYSREIRQVEKEISKPASSTNKGKIGHNLVSTDEFTSLSATIDWLESGFLIFKSRVQVPFDCEET